MGLRERYLETGPHPLDPAELLALVLGTGVPGVPALALARSVLDDTGGTVGLREAEPAELARIHGIGLAQAVRVHAAIQLGRRIHSAERRGRRVTSVQSAYIHFAPALMGLESEELHGLFLDRRRRVLGYRVLTRGSAAFTIVDPRQIFRRALKLGASAVILAHNHPSGDPTPSRHDRQVTERVASAGRLLGIPLLDHLIIGGSSYTSLAQEGGLCGTEASLPVWTE